MKKLIPILLAVFALASCEKDPDRDPAKNARSHTAQKRGPYPRQRFSPPQSLQ